VLTASLLAKDTPLIAYSFLDAQYDDMLDVMPNVLQ